MKWIDGLKEFNKTKKYKTIIDSLMKIIDENIDNKYDLCTYTQYELDLMK